MSAAVYDTLRAITTATITTMLLKKGIRRCWMNGPKPLVADGARLVGPAFTLRFRTRRAELLPALFGHTALLEAYFAGELDVEGNLAMAFRARCRPIRAPA